MGFNETSAQLETNTQPTEPRLRVNKTTTTAITTSWQPIVYDGTSTYNTNSFSTLQGQTNPSLWYDSANNLFKFTPNTDQNYTFTPSFSISATTILTSLNLATITIANVQFRFYIPAPTPVTFPLPDFGGYIDMGPVNLVAQNNYQKQIPVYANALIRQYGVQAQIKLSASTLGTINLSGSDMNIF